MAASRAGDVILTKLEANRHRVLKTPHLARSSDAGYLKIVAPWQGTASVEQQGRQAWVRSGGWTIYDTTGSYEIANPERCEHLIVMLPKEQVLERGMRLEPLMARHVGGASGISRVALETMRSTYQELPSMSEAAARGAGELIVQLVRLSLLELAGRETGVTQLEALKDRIRGYVHRHLRDPGLSIERIALALNCSKRHLHNALPTGTKPWPATSCASAWKPACATCSKAACKASGTTHQARAPSPTSPCPGAFPTCRTSAACSASTPAPARANSGGTPRHAHPVIEGTCERRGVAAALRPGRLLPPGCAVRLERPGLHPHQRQAAGIRFGAGAPVPDQPLRADVRRDHRVQPGQGGHAVQQAA